MLRSQLQELFDLLDEQEFRSGSDISRHLGVSLKTVRNHMKELGMVLRENGADVEARPRYGYRLCVKDSDRFNKFLREEEPSIPRTSLERTSFILHFLLTTDEFTKIDDLCDLLFISRSSISASVRTVEKTLNQYNIRLERKPGYGIRAVGEEFDIRRLLYFHTAGTRYLASLNQDETYMSEDRLWISRKILDLLARFDVHMTEVALDNFINYVLVGVQRLMGKHLLHFETRQFPVSGIKERVFTRELKQCIEEQYGLSLSEDEEKYILLYLSGKQLCGYAPVGDSNFVISEEINALAGEILSFIDRDYQTSFAESLDLKMALNQHLVPLEVRIKYGLPLTNPMRNTTRKEFPLAYGMAMHAAVVIDEHYHTNLSEDEISYLALIFALQLDKVSASTRRKVNILLVSSANSSALLLMKRQYENRLSPYINNVYITDFLGLPAYDFTDIDYVFSTVPVSVDVPCPIFEISQFASPDLSTIEEMLWKTDRNGLRRFFTPERFITCVKGRDKDSIIKELCEIVMANETVDEDFYEMVMKREQDPQVTYGTGAAIPHPDRLCSAYTFGYLAVLPEPVIWNDESVQVVLLTSPGREDPLVRQDYYETMARLVLDPAKISRLADRPEYDFFVRLLDE